MFKSLFCFLLVFVTVCVPFSAFAESKASAYLSNVTTNKNSLFETTLSVNTNVAAFIATLEFDESKVEFRKAKALSENTVLSVNTNEKGKVTLAFLNESGTEGEILALTFKSKTANAFIDLSLEQVIDKNAADITLTSVKGTNITITAKEVYKNESENEPEDKTHTNAETPPLSQSKDKLSLSVPAKESSGTRLIVCLSLGSVLLVAIGAVGFILGKNLGSKNKNRKNKYEKNS